MVEPRIVRCLECQAEIVFLQSAKDPNKRVPVDADAVASTDEIYDGTRHVSHFKTCTNPARFSKGRR